MSTWSTCPECFAEASIHLATPEDLETAECTECPWRGDPDECGTDGVYYENFGAKYEAGLPS